MCLLWGGSFVAQARYSERPKVAVVLSGGGAKGVAHIGALKVIEEAGIPIDMVVGTSMGAVVGGLYSVGYTSGQLDTLVRHQDWSFLLSDKVKRTSQSFLQKESDAKYVLSIPFTTDFHSTQAGGLIKGRNLNNLFIDLMPGYQDTIDFNDLPIPFACVAENIVDGSEVVFHDGVLPVAMRASMAIPAVFSPVVIDGQVLVDGGMTNNFPVDVARSMGADYVIGVDVQSSLKSSEELLSASAVLGQIIDLSGQERYEQNLTQTDVYIKVNVKGYSSASFNKPAIDTLTRRGEEAARETWPELVALQKKIGRKADLPETSRIRCTPLSERKDFYIHNITFSGIQEVDVKWIMRKCRLKERSRITSKTLEETLAVIHATQAFSDVHYTLHDTLGGYNLRFELKEQRMNRFDVGLFFDTEEIASAQLHTDIALNTKVPTAISATVRLGKRIGARADFYVKPSLLRNFNFSYMFRHNDINIYNRGSRAYNTIYNYHMGEIGYSDMDILRRNMKMSIGLRYEHYDYKYFLFNHDGDGLDVKPEGFFGYFVGLDYDSFDKRYFPMRGTRFKVGYDLYTDNMATYRGHNPFSALNAWWTMAIGLSERFALQPTIYGRFLFGFDIPFPFLNALGGSDFGHYVPQQLPFAGINYMTIVGHQVIGVGIQGRQRFGARHYLFASGNYALTDNSFRELIQSENFWGFDIGYGYDSRFGPLMAAFNFSNETKKLGFYLQLGFKF